MSAVIERSSFPADADGEVLYRLALKGIDLSQKRKIEFYCYASSRDTAAEIAEDLATYGYDPRIAIDDDDGASETTISVYAEINMLPDYELLIIEQKRLDVILKRYGTRCDGWGSLLPQ